LTLNTRGIILTTAFFTILIVANSSQHSIFAQSTSTTPSSPGNETRGSSTGTTGTSENTTIGVPSENYPSEYYPRGNASLAPPNVIFPTAEEIENYFLDKNVTAPTFIGNSSMGNVTNIQQASSNGTTYVVFQTEVNDTDRVFLTIIGDAKNSRGASFSPPVELTPATHGNISNLQIATDQNNTFAVWQNYNSTTGLNSIFVSSSMDSGRTFRTFQATENNVDAIDPLITAIGVITFKVLCSDSTVLEPLWCPMYYIRW
jgi:hypothetical protein